MIGCLAFLPPEEIGPAFRKLKLMMPQELEPLVEYFENNWVLGKLNKILRDGSEVRGKPRFNPKLWSVYERNGKIEMNFLID